MVEEGAAQQAGAAATVGVEAVGVEAAAKAQEAGAAGAAQEAGAAGANPRRAEPAARPEGLRRNAPYAQSESTRGTAAGLCRHQCGGRQRNS